MDWMEIQIDKMIASSFKRHTTPGKTNNNFACFVIFTVHKTL